jgi:hypothetical protein
MSELYFSTDLSGDENLCISTLTDKKAAAAGPEVQRNPVGYFLYVATRSPTFDNISVIARVLSEEAAINLSKLLGMK